MRERPQAQCVRARNLDRLLRPRHVAVIGGDDAAMAARQCGAFGFDGPVWAVNRTRADLGGYPCLRSVEALPGVPDAVFLAVPKAATLPLVKELRELGAGGVVCFAAGYAEQGREGRQHQDALVAQAGDMALLGPNCYGLINSADGVALWPYLHGCSRVERGVALISQSGMLATSLTMNARSVAFSHVISIGNQAMLGAEDFIEALEHDPCVSAFALYIEGLRDAGRFERVARRLAGRGRPIVALLAGRSRPAARIIARHTGASGADTQAVGGCLADAGVIQVQTPNQLLETLKFVSASQPPKGTRMAAFTCSGGDAAVLADCGEAHGIAFPQPSRRVAARLRRLMPAIATVSNPLDCTTQLWGRPEIEGVFATMLEDEYDVALFVQDWPRPDIAFDKETDLREAAQFAAAARRRGIPAIICSSMFENIDADTRGQLLSVGAVPMQGFAEAMAAVSQASWFGSAAARLAAGTD